MTKHFRSLNQVEIAAPCDADWDSMTGNDQVRLCDHCDLHVTDLSRLTRPEAMRMVERSRGRLCVRYMRTAGGEILTRESQRLHRIGRRVSRIAAGAFSATLSISSAIAQTGSLPSKDESKVVQTIAQSKVTETGTASTISGVITDPIGAVVPGATVTLTNTGTGSEVVTTSSDEGTYKFKTVAAGLHKIKIASFGFKDFELTDIDLRASSTKNFETTLELLETVTVTMGVVAIADPKDPLIKAAYKNDLASLKAFLPLTADIDANDEDTGINALAYAIENHNLEIVNLLLSAGANVNAASNYGRTPIMYLNEGATVEFVRALLLAGANVNAHDERGESVLMAAVSSCKLEVLKELVAAGARMDAKDTDGNTILIFAAANADEKVVSLLIEAGVSVDATNENGESALTFATRFGKGAVLKALINGGATINLTSKDLAGALVTAIDNEDSSTVKAMLDAGANPNSVDSDHKTALMQAAQNGKPGAVKVLIESGADINVVDDDGWTALMYCDDVESLRVLLNAGADPNIRNKKGQTVLAIASEAGQEDIVKLLKSRGAPQ